MFQGLRSMTAVVLALVMVMAMLPAQLVRAADTATMTEEEAVNILKQYDIVRGDQTGDINGDDRLTRAEAATLFVRLLDREDEAILLAGLVPFGDAKGHWAAGEITVVNRLGLMQGDPNGLFRPDDDITYVEVLTVLLRMVDQEPNGPWNPASIIVQANRLGIAPQVSDLRVPAIRGKMFWSLAVAATNIPVDEKGTLIQKHLDSVPPRLVLDKTNITTAEDKVTISGITEGASKVLVNDSPAKLDQQNGAFSYQAQIPVGASTLVVTAVDPAGNESTASVSINRQGVISRLRVTGPATIVANSSTKLTVEVKDSRGNDLPRDQVKVELTGPQATFDIQTGTLTTTSESGRGTLTLSGGSVRSTYTFSVIGPSASAKALYIMPINSDRAPAVNQEVTVTVQVVDAEGKVVSADYGRTVSLKSQGLAGLTITPVKPVTEKGVATFTLKGSRIGTAHLEASTSGLETATKSLEVLSEMRIALTTTVKSMKPDGTSIATVRATLMDQNGRAINNPSSSDIVIQLTSTGTDGVLIDDYVVIPNGRSNSSNDDGAFQAGIMPGTAVIKGSIMSSHAYSIQTLQLPVDGVLAGARLQVTSSDTSVEPGDTVTLTLSVVGSNNKLVTDGSYAFQLRLSTSNNDPLLNGMPEGASLSFRNSSYTPVDDGRADTDPYNSQYAVVGRTNKGIAEVTLTYNRSGSLTITPVLSTASYEAYHPTTGFGPASSSSHLIPSAVIVTFAGTPAKIVLTADSDLASDAPAAATNKARQIKVRAKVVDASGATVPGYKEAITLTRLSEGDAVSSIVGISKKAAVNGVAEFTVQLSGTEGFDLYRASVGALPSADMSVALHKSKPEAPQIVAIRGIKEGDLSPETGYVGPDADYMDIQLLPQASYLGGEPTNWVVAKVYRKGESREFFTSGAINLNSPIPTIRIPKRLLKVGEAQYEVVVNNGAGDSVRSPSLDDTSKAMNVVYHTAYRLTGAAYDAVAGTLKLSASGLTANGVLDTSKLRFEKGEETADLTGAEISALTSSSILLKLGDLASTIDADRFHGTTTVVADTGWFSSSNGSQIGQPQTVGVTPMAVVHQGAVDAANKYLYLYGDGFSQGSLTTTLITIRGTNGEVKLTASDKIKSATDSQMVITLSPTSLGSIMALQGPLHLTADAGWLKSSSGKVAAITGTDHSVYLQAKITSVAYERGERKLTLRGNGFGGATVDPTKLTFQRTTTTGTWSPASSASVIGESDDVIEIIFSETDATAFETQFGGKNVYANTLEGWLVDELNRAALPVPANSVLFTVPVR